MPRSIRIVAVGVPYHITQRGNRKQDVFYSDKERARYLEWLAEYSHKYSFDIHAYCLMTTHVHIVGTPNEETSLSRTIQMTQSRHTQALNASQGCTGHLWQGRYFASMLDEYHLYAAIRYVEQNPVRAGMVDRAVDYPWSSAACHCGLRDDPTLAGNPPWDGMLEGWPELLGTPLDEDRVEELRVCTSTGRPWADDVFVDRISAIIGRSVEKRPRGRPRLDRPETDD